MPIHSETRRLPYSPDQLFQLVADVERYPEFLPWCIGAKIHERTNERLVADLTIGYGILRETFTSSVKLTPSSRIDVDYIKGPFSRLTNFWTFRPDGAGCVIEFHIDFEFRSRTLGRLMGLFFHEATRHMIAAFEARAKAIY